jgi:hypothetical protein
MNVADAKNYRIRRISSSANVTTLGGSQSGFADGIGAAAKLAFPVAVQVTKLGMNYIGDVYNHAIRQLTLDGNLTTLAGTPTSTGKVLRQDSIPRGDWPLMQIRC